jgi:hypothetical protein
VIKICKNCKKEFEVKSARIYCSDQCKKEYYENKDNYCILCERRLRIKDNYCGICINGIRYEYNELEIKYLILILIIKGYTVVEGYDEILKIMDFKKRG